MKTDQQQPQPQQQQKQQQKQEEKKIKNLENDELFHLFMKTTSNKLYGM